MNITQQTHEMIQSLREAAERVLSTSSDEFDRETNRFDNFHYRFEDLLIDWSRQIVDHDVVESLEQYAEQVRVHNFLQSMTDGNQVNFTEERAAAHTEARSLRTESNSFTQARQQMLALAKEIRSQTHRGCTNKPVTDILHVGIGGSHLGPALVDDVLNDLNCSIRLHFVTNVQPKVLNRRLRVLNPETTLCVVASKSYTTYETLANAQQIRRWFIERLPPLATLHNHFVHITSKVERTPPEEITLSIPESVGGRFSVWSAMGFSIATKYGSQPYLDLLEGARAVDVHTLRSTTPSDNIAIRLATLALWNTNVLHASSHLILPYDSRLRLLPSYLQQLEMESNGKHTTRSNDSVPYFTCPAVWGGPETESQHAFHQWLHQGTFHYSADIVAVREHDRSTARGHSDPWNLANAIAQSVAMFRGQPINRAQPYRNVYGKHGSTLIVLDQLDARSLGSLLAIYEHKVACLGYFWGINSFDQWGVEASKVLATNIHTALQNKSTDSLDPLTKQVVHKIQEH